MLVQIEKIRVPDNRYRREFDERKLKELRDSISRLGLINPITVEREGEESFILRAGERRLRSVTSLHKDKVGIPGLSEGLILVRDYATLTELERLEVEVEENVVRADFSWQERSIALAALHKLRTRQNPQQSVTMTATEVMGRGAVGGQISFVSEALLVVKHMSNPAVAAAKSQKEAVKIIERQAEEAKRATLAKNFRPENHQHTLLQGDSLTLLRTLPDRHFDVILTDPPYGIGANSFGDMAGEGHAYNDSEAYFEQIVSVFCDESARICKPAAHAYVFCDPRRFDRLSLLMVLAGWTVFPVPLIWHKGNSGMLPFPDHGPRRTYEAILYAWRGDRRTNAVRADVISNIPAVSVLRHGAQKPVALYEDLLSRSANPGDRVLDCFGGTGPILVAANRLSLVATYIEMDEAAYNIAVARLAVKDLDDGVKADDGLNLDL